MLECPHAHPIPESTHLEFYCPGCRTNHQLPSDFITSKIEKSHREYLDKLLTKLTLAISNQVKLAEALHATIKTG